MAALNTWTVRPEDYKQAGDKDWTQAFQRLFVDVTHRLTPDGGGSVPVATVEVLLTGVYTVSDTIMLAGAGRAQGLTVRGLGKRASEIVMTAGKPLLINHDQWMGVTWYDCSFRSTNKGATALYSWSTGGAQDWNFVRAEWRGAWDAGIVLDGPATSNCNSEWVWDRCTVTGTYETAWLYSGKSPQYPQQDQFLNFSLRDMKMEPTYGDMLRFDKGGSINVRGGSWIMQGQRPNGAPSRFFYLPNTGPHFDSVSNLLVEGVRFELRNGAAQVIDSAWNGQVTFIGCDDTALGFQSFSSAPGFVAHQYRNPGGVTYIGCQLVGHHGYDASGSLSRQVATYMSCGRKNFRTAATFLIRTGVNAGQLKFVHIADRDGIA